MLNKTRIAALSAALLVPVAAMAQTTPPSLDTVLGGAKTDMITNIWTAAPYAIGVGVVVLGLGFGWRMIRKNGKSA